MNRAPKDRRSAAELVRDTAGIVGSWIHEGYVVTPAAEAVHARVERGEITTEEAIAIFRERAQRLDAKITARQRTFLDRSSDSTS